MMWNFSCFYNNIALKNEKNENITYYQLEQNGKKIIDNIKSRTLVFSLCSNSIGSILGYTAFISGKIVPLLLDSNLDRELLLELIGTYKPDYIWLPKKCVYKFDGYTTVLELFDYSLIKTNYNREYVLNDELALLLTTSGSTGSPKLVRQSYKNILANTESIVKYLEIDSKERPITTLPMNYTYGLSIINTHLYMGSTILVTEKSIIEREFWEFFNSNGATSFGGVPYTYEILDKLRVYNRNLESLKTFTQAGGKLTIDLHEKFAKYAEKNNKKFIVMYGQTEATARMGYLPYDKCSIKYGSMGIAIPNGKFSLINENGQEIFQEDVIGELKYEGDNVSLGYAENIYDLSKGDERGGVLFTGDMAKKDKDGYYYIVGRKKRFLKIFGNRINLDETERLLKSKFINMECACSGTDDNMYIFTTNISLKDEIKKYVSNKTGLNLIAFKVKEIDKIPRNEFGKTLYSELEVYYD